MTNLLRHECFPKLFRMEHRNMNGLNMVSKKNNVFRAQAMSLFFSHPDRELCLKLNLVPVLLQTWAPRSVVGTAAPMMDLISSPVLHVTVTQASARTCLGPDKWTRLLVVTQLCIFFITSQPQISTRVLFSSAHDVNGLRSTSYVMVNSKRPKP